MDRRAHIVVAAVFLAVIMAPGLIQTVSELRNGEQPRALDVFLQPPTAQNLHGVRAEPRGDEPRDQAAPAVDAVPSVEVPRRCRREGRSGASGLALLSTERAVCDRAPNAAPESDAADPLAAIRSFRDQLQAMGIRLLVVPVPNKESVYPEMLAGRAADAGVVVCEQTRRLLDQLEQRGIEYVDLFEVFRRARQEESPVRIEHGSTWRRTATGRRRVHAWPPAPSRGGCSMEAPSVGVITLTSTFGHRPAPRAIWLRCCGCRRSSASLEPESLACLQVVQSDTGTPYRDATGVRGPDPGRQLPADL